MHSERGMRVECAEADGGGGGYHMSLVCFVFVFERRVHPHFVFWSVRTRLLNVCVCASGEMNGFWRAERGGGIRAITKEVGREEVGVGGGAREVS